MKDQWRNDPQSILRNISCTTQCIWDPVLYQGFSLRPFPISLGNVYGKSSLFCFFSLILLHPPDVCEMDSYMRREEGGRKGKESEGEEKEKKGKERKLNNNGDTHLSSAALGPLRIPEDKNPAYWSTPLDF